MKHGEAKIVAKKAGITGAYLSAILLGKKIPSAVVALSLEVATGIDRRAWLYPGEYQNPLLKVKNHGNPDNSATTD